jgi:ubiquinone/menaquinone biosynthesis C-methylase UbiE
MDGNSGTARSPRVVSDTASQSPHGMANGQDAWTDPETVAGWRKWARAHAAQTRPMTELLLEAAQVREGMAVLDLASGAGEPALSLAHAVGTHGRVVATDISAGMLELIDEDARAQGLNNLTTRMANAEALPFEDAVFDRLTCRQGIMHVPDADRALREARRVLKTGGRAAFLVWGPPTGQTMMIHQAVLARHIEIPRPAPDAPGPFRYAQSGTLAAALRRAGFQDVQEATHHLRLSWPGTPQQWLQQTVELAGPLRALLARLSPGTRQQVEQEVQAALAPHYDGERLSLLATVNVATGQP